jgi:hypothetical protein
MAYSKVVNGRSGFQICRVSTNADFRLLQWFIVDADTALRYLYCESGQCLLMFRGTFHPLFHSIYSRGS